MSSNKLNLPEKEIYVQLENQVYREVYAASTFGYTGFNDYDLTKGFCLNLMIIQDNSLCRVRLTERDFAQLGLAVTKMETPNE